MMRLAVTGTDTGVGKTIVAAALLTMLRRDGLSVGVMKPVDAKSGGGDEASDVDLLLAASGGSDGCDDVGALVRLETRAADGPILESEGANVISLLDAEFARTAAGRDTVIVEDPGGLLVPVAPGISFERLARRWNLDLLVVAADRPGLVSHLLLVARAAREAGLRIRGVVINELYADRTGELEISTTDTLADALPGVPIFRFPFLARPLDPSALAAAAASAGLDSLRAPVISLPRQSPLTVTEGEEQRA
ncbi:MAG TPA: dethiobiotin synthase [Gemmatimonadaceae bacterium]|jgi:dethiobiotin synthetase|nr:dethiobiotin synthase [Gemmatimonadaceae bacterium]